MMQGKLCWVMFAAAVGMVACTGDPTADLRNGVDHVTASPANITLNQGDSVGVIVEAVDEQGNRIETSFAASSTDPQVSVAQDLGFIPVYDENNQLVPPTSATRARFFVKALGLTSTTMTVSAGGKTRDVPILTGPTSLGGNYTPAPPLSNIGLFDTITVTPPAGLEFDVAVPPTIAGAPGDPLVTDFTATSLSFVPAGGTSGPLTARMIFAFAGGTSGATLTDSVILNKPGGGLATGGLATAPTIPIPATGNTEVLYDKGSFNGSADCNNSPVGFPCRLYKIVLAAPTSFDVSATWFDGAVGATTDLGIYFLNAAGAGLVGTTGCDSHGNDGAPETCSVVNLAAGTYFVGVFTFSPAYPAPDDVDPPSFQLLITGT